MSSPNNSEVESGQGISLTCLAEGSSLSHFTWSRDDAILDAGDPRVTITTQAPSSVSLQSVLVISPADVGDSGSYSCRAFSPVGNSSASFSLFVTSEYVSHYYRQEEAT